MFVWLYKLFQFIGWTALDVSLLEKVVQKTNAGDLEWNPLRFGSADSPTRTCVIDDYEFTLRKFGSAELTLCHISSKRHIYNERKGYMVNRLWSAVRRYEGVPERARNKCLLNNLNSLLEK
jgi:hypothetical protein